MFADAVNQLVDLVIQLEKSLTERRSPGKKMCLFIGGETAAHVMSSLYGDLSELDSIIAQRSTHPSYHMMTGTRSLTLNLYSLNTSMINRYIYPTTGKLEDLLEIQKQVSLYQATVLHEYQGIPINKTLHQEALRKQRNMDEIKEIVKELEFRSEEVKKVRNNWVYSSKIEEVREARDLLLAEQIDRKKFLHLAFGYGCIHKTKKWNCRECGGSAYCIHDKLKAYCRECGGSAYCIHDKQKAYCRECGGSAFCIHDKVKTVCRTL